VNTLHDLRPGDLGFAPISGAVGLGVGLGQIALGEGFRVGDLSIRHVFVVTEALHDEPPSAEWPTGVINKGSLVEAMPSGAREAPLMLDHWTGRFAYARLPEDYPGQAADAAAIARAMIGTPYSFASYAALAAWRFGVKTTRLEKWIGRRKPPQHMAMSGPVPRNLPGRWIGLPEEAICSVLADQAWSLTGKKIMQGVPHQCVTPGALAGRLLTMSGVQWFWPGES
jgi:hypothetical protein